MPVSLEYGLLGPLVVRRAGRSVPVNAGRQRALLAALLLRPGRLIDMDELVEVLWGARPPRSPRSSLHTQMGRLRKALGAGPDSPIATEAGGYLIQVAPGAVDVGRFEAAVQAGGDAAAAGDWARSAGLLRGGLSLWRGEPLAGVGSELLASREAPRLAELRHQALEARIDADLQLGRHRAVIAELRQLAAAEPLRERVHSLLMTALQRDGQQAAALSAYQAARRFLVEELGAEPGAELQDLHQQVLAGQLPAVPGTVAPDRPSPVEAPAEPVRFSLPPDLASFTGREPELGQVTAMTEGHQIAPGAVTTYVISGMPGIGKTALAVHAAHLLRERYPDRQLFIDLHGFTPGRAPAEPEEALGELLTAAGLSPRYLPPGVPARAAMWRDKMAGQRAVLVLDNAVSSAQVAPLLPGTAGCLVLVTSRRHLADLPGSPLPVLMEVLTADEASAMFVRMAPRATGEPARAVAELMELAGFLPLAISLLARLYAHHPSWGLADLAAETRARMLTLTADQDSVAAAFEVSLRHQDPSAQEMFARLGLHPGDTFDVQAAAALAGTTAAQAGDLLDRLHAEGLIKEAGHRRYELHDLLRRFAAVRAGRISPASSQQAVERLLDFYQLGAARAQALLTGPAARAGQQAAAATGMAPELTGSRAALEWARAERASLLACLDHVTAAGQRARMVSLTASLATLLLRDGAWAEAMSRHAAAARAARELADAAGEAAALRHLGDARRMTGDLAGAEEALRQALAIGRRLGDQAGVALTLESLGSARRLAAAFAESETLLREAQASFAEIGDGLGQARCLHLLATLRVNSGDYPAAVRHLQAARSHFGAAGDRHGVANTLHLHGVVLLDTGDHPAAEALLCEARAAYAEVGERNGIANCLHGLSSVRRAAGDLAGAARLLADALAGYRELGSRIGQAHSLEYLGTLRRELGDHEAAGEALAEALSVYGRISNRQGEVHTLIAMGQLHRERAELRQASDCLVRALTLAREIASGRDEASALAELGRCALADGEAALGRARLQEAHDILRRAGAPEAAAVAAEAQAIAPAPSARPALATVTVRGQDARATR